VATAPVEVKQAPIEIEDKDEETKVNQRKSEAMATKDDSEEEEGEIIDDNEDLELVKRRKAKYELQRLKEEKATKA